MKIILSTISSILLLAQIALCQFPVELPYYETPKLDHSGPLTWSQHLIEERFIGEDDFLYITDKHNRTYLRQNIHYQNGKVYQGFTNGGSYSNIICMDAETGEVEWLTDLNYLTTDMKRGFHLKSFDIIDGKIEALLTTSIDTTVNPYITGDSYGYFSKAMLDLESGEILDLELHDSLILYDIGMPHQQSRIEDKIIYIRYGYDFTSPNTDISTEYSILNMESMEREVLDSVHYDHLDNTHDWYFGGRTPYVHYGDNWVGYYLIMPKGDDRYLYDLRFNLETGEATVEDIYDKLNLANNQRIYDAFNLRNGNIVLQTHTQYHKDSISSGYIIIDHKHNMLYDRREIRLADNSVFVKLDVIEDNQTDNLILIARRNNIPNTVLYMDNYTDPINNIGELINQNDPFYVFYPYHTTQDEEGNIYGSMLCSVDSIVARNYYNPHYWTYLYKIDRSGLRIEPSSTKANPLATLTLYPNPASHILNIKDAYSYQRYRISDMLGTTMDQGVLYDQQLDIRHLKSGTYHLTLYDGKRQASTLFLKVR